MMKRWFYRHSEGQIVQNWKPLPNAGETGVVDDIMVGIYDGDGTVRYEFRIEQYVFKRGDYAIRVSLFDDAFEAFVSRDFAPLFQWLAKEKPKSLDAVQEWLESHGYVNRMRERDHQKITASDENAALSDAQDRKI